MEVQNRVSDIEKIAYLKEWGWVSEIHEAGFDVWSHKRIPNRKYKLDRAYQTMKDMEPTTDPVITAKFNNPSEMNQIKEFTAEIIQTPKERAVKNLAKVLGVSNTDDFLRKFDL